MSMTVACPACSRTLNVPDDLVGELVKCPLCSQQFRVDPQHEPAPPTLPPVEPITMPYIPEADRPSKNKAEEDEAAWKLTPNRRRDLEPHRGTVILVLGILSICLGVGCIGIVLGPIAWAMGASDLRAIREGRMDPSGEGTTRAGYTCGIVGTVLGILGWSGCCGLQFMRFHRF